MSKKVFKIITADNGPEFLNGAGIREAAKCDDVYYAHPFSSWERGSNENGNGILRRFLPKGSDFSKLTTKELQRIEDWVNNYPRKIMEGTGEIYLPDGTIAVSGHAKYFKVPLDEVFDQEVFENQWVELGDENDPTEITI